MPVAIESGIISAHTGVWRTDPTEAKLSEESKIVSTTITELDVSHKGSVARGEGGYKFVAEEFSTKMKRGGVRTRSCPFSNLPETDVNGLVLVQFSQWIHTFALTKNLLALRLRRGTHHELLVVGKLLPDLQKQHVILQHGNVEGLFGTALDYQNNERGLILAYYYAPTVRRGVPSSRYAFITPEQRVLAVRI